MREQNLDAQGQVAIDLPQEILEHRAVFTSTLYETLHPIVRVHPESGERGLFIGDFVRRLRDLSQNESDHIQKGEL